MTVHSHTPLGHAHCTSDVIEMSVVRGMIGVGGVYEMGMCLARGEERGVNEMIGIGFGTSPAFMRSSARYPVGLLDRLVQKSVAHFWGRGFRHNFHGSL